MDTSLWLLHSLRLDWPVDWTAVFGRSAPLLMEIGFGGADFLVDLTESRPEANVIGVELSLPSLKKGPRSCKRAICATASVVQGAGQLVLWALCLPDSLDEVYINFPDPWPKERHHGRRLISDTFLHLLATRLKAGGRLDIATDHADYAAWIVRHLERSPCFASRLPATYVNEDPERITTKYEQKGSMKGAPVIILSGGALKRRPPIFFPSPRSCPCPMLSCIHHLAWRKLAAGLRRKAPGRKMRVLNCWKCSNQPATASCWWRLTFEKSRWRSALA
ncbi:MAG: tRNA (guanosine(46)-N7)-methyltransferase TrmB [Chloroflexi bacterium]|nr:tRNA (guanosine(46)-N7)-methyltransferase TrmB [Chloroflexota bacterium]